MITGKQMLQSPLSAVIGILMAFMALSPSWAEEPATDSPQDTILEDDLTPPQPFQVVGFGDSLMAGYRLAADKSFTAQLENALQAKGYNVSITNAGISADTTTGGLERIDWSVPDGTGLVILELGANDMLRGITPDLTEKNLDLMLARLQERKIPVIFVGMLSAPNLGKENADKFNPIYPRLAEKYHTVFYPFFLDGVAGEQNLQLDDGMHPNEKGVGVMVEKMLPLVEKTLTGLGVNHQP